MGILRGIFSIAWDIITDPDPDSDWVPEGFDTNDSVVGGNNFVVVEQAQPNDAILYGAIGYHLGKGKS